MPDTPLPPDHLDRLAEQRRSLRALARAAQRPGGGFGWLGDDGRLDPAYGVELWITARMTHVAALAVLEGDASFEPVVDHGVATFAPGGLLHDGEHGGWFASVHGDGSPDIADKRAYEHAFVVLAATSASAARRPGADELLDGALQTFEQRFWRESDGLALDVWDRTWTDLEDYRGVNANMHSLEALLAAWDVTRDPRWLGHALRITERVVHGFARSWNYRLPEHFDARWEPRPDYNRDRPTDKFRPFGVTPGHLLEWSRLSLHLRHALGAEAPAWLLDEARSLFDVAVHEGWDVDGHEGFVYTTDFEGRPVVRDRLHWVVTEAIGAARTLHLATGDPTYAAWYDRWWEHAHQWFVDPEQGSWRHELSPELVPSSVVWQGRPDVYHAYQACLVGALGEITSFAGALRDGALQTPRSA
ncbi:AGE family epimerase/isomerase [Terrabacter sp. Soil810]|uniref:AGE family epimerase/isomerase n=1 Tax=Terrabacter sp. Soil810 TaxID=1736418 RepID=UPI00070B5B33|nr:AGE family epimerase/isomerase [Terrabacter sp. Soil810]KRF40298.1 N-acyl-D-glucosamine 2-epimerase [Terrabacter sp. Soil810]